MTVDNHTYAGRRWPDGELPTEPGGYSKIDGFWHVSVPETGFPVARLTVHQIDEHSDGTITVHGSIPVDGSHGKHWHGYLEAGSWRKA